MEAQKQPQRHPDPSIPHPKKLTRRDFLIVALGGGALALAANTWLKQQDMKQGQIIRMFQMRAAPGPFDRPAQRPTMCVIDARDIVTGEDIQVQLPAARGKADQERQDRLMSADMKDDLLVIGNAGALDGARWGQIVTEKGRRIIKAGYDQVQIRVGQLRKIRENAEKPQ